MTNQGILWVLSAPSGTGKSTLGRALVEQDPKLQFSVSFTTRPPRSGEVNGQHYHFETTSNFKKMIETGMLLEWAEVYENFYGTGRNETERILAEGKDLILDIDIQGAQQIRAAWPEAVLIFILPPNYETLKKRLIDRKSDSVGQQSKRLALAAEEAMQYHLYDYLIVNDCLTEAQDQLKAVMTAERLRTHRQQHVATSILDGFPKGGG